MTSYWSRNQRIASGFSGSPALHTRRKRCGYRVRASPMDIIERIAVGVAKTFVTSWRLRKSSCRPGSKPPSRCSTHCTAPSRQGPSSGEIPAAHAHSPMPWKRSPSVTSWQYVNSSCASRYRWACRIPLASPVVPDV